MVRKPADLSAADMRIAEIVAARLRTSEMLDPSFEPRVMQTVRAEIRARYPRPDIARASWWGTPRTIRFTPIGALALAAGVSGIVALSVLSAGSGRFSPSAASHSPLIAAAARTDTITLVRFVFTDTRARTVEIVGDFNKWTRGVTPLERSRVPGVWEASVALTAGRHEYAFIVNGSRWVIDPLATASSDDFGIESSVVRVSAPASI